MDVEGGGKSEGWGHVNRLPKYLGALPAGPNDRHSMFIPRLLLQLMQLCPGLMRRRVVEGGGHFKIHFAKI